METEYTLLLSWKKTYNRNPICFCVDIDDVKEGKEFDCRPGGCEETLLNINALVTFAVWESAKLFRQYNSHLGKAIQLTFAEQPLSLSSKGRYSSLKSQDMPCYSSSYDRKGVEFRRRDAFSAWCRVPYSYIRVLDQWRW